MLITVLVIQKTKHNHSLSILRPQVRFHKGVVDGFREWGRWRAGWAFLAINIHVKRRDKDSQVQIQGTLVRSPAPGVCGSAPEDAGRPRQSRPSWAASSVAGPGGALRCWGRGDSELLHFTRGGVGQACGKSADRWTPRRTFEHEASQVSRSRPAAETEHGSKGGTDKDLWAELDPVNNSEALTSIPAREVLGKLAVSDFLGHLRIEVAGSSQLTSGTRVNPELCLPGRRLPGPHTGGTHPRSLGQVLGGDHGQQPVHHDPELGASKVSCSG